MKCPKCENVGLASQVVSGIEVDCCPQCHGIWFDKTELEHLLDLTAKDLKPLIAGKSDDAINAKHGKCPRDLSELLRVCSALDATLILDTCVNCHGVWLDGGELSRLVKR